MAHDRFRTGTRWHQFCNERRYDAPADPWKLVWVDPSEVQRYNVVTLAWGLGMVVGGDWDRSAQCGGLRETATYESLRRRFTDGVDWVDTRLYERARSRFEDGETVRGYESIEAFRDQRLSALDDLYEAIRSEGYSPNGERLYEAPADIESVHDMEPMVVVGREGELVWTEGFHRHALAELAGVDEIPVHVLRRHVEWQRKRDELATVSPEERDADLDALTDHPDLVDVDC